MKTCCKKEGYTLLEIVVAITLFALMALMLTRVFSESTRVVGRENESEAIDETARLLMNSLENDISQALVRNDAPFFTGSLSSPNDTLSFVSTGMRRQHETIPRDTAPMRIQTLENIESGWSVLALEIETPNNASGNSSGTRENLLVFSDYYRTNLSAVLPGFGGEADTFPAEYTSLLDQDLEDHTVLTFLRFTVNGDAGWTTGGSDLPRFADVSIGLISSSELVTAIRRNDAAYAAEREQVYARRILIRNSLNLQTLTEGAP